jgi:hypothetical protein
VNNPVFDFPAHLKAGPLPRSLEILRHTSCNEHFFPAKCRSAGRWTGTRDK